MVLGNFLGQLMVLNSWLFLPDVSWTGDADIGARMRKVAESRHQFCAHLAWYFHLCPTLPTLLNGK